MFKTLESQLLSLVLFLSFANLSYQLLCSVPNSDGKIILGGQAVVCIHFSLQTQKTNRTYAFKVTVDKFSALTVTGIKDLLAKQTTTTKIFLQFQNNETTYSMDAFIPAEGSVKPLYRDVYSFVINLQQGNATLISLDNANCDVCDTSSGDYYCRNETECFSISQNSKYGNGTATDPKLFISWVGTDSQGNYMLSHTKRLSRFTQYSVGSIYQKAKTLVTQ